VVILVDGRLNFNALQRRLVTAAAKARDLVASTPARYVAFDLLAVGAVDLRTLPAPYVPSAMASRSLPARSSYDSSGRAGQRLVAA
jgi:hypothetical protein